MKNKKKTLLAFAMFAFACIAFVMHLCNYANFEKCAEMIFRTLLLVYLLLYMKDK